MKKQEVLLVDEHDNVLGTEEKLTAHLDGGVLHRAFSLFLLNEKGEMLLQKRATCKYHCPNLWTNACCSHPGREHSIEDFARDRLRYEMGMGCGVITNLYSFVYRKEFDNGLTEHELDHVLIAKTHEKPTPCAEEVVETRWVSVEDLLKDLKIHPEKYTHWFQMICHDTRFQDILTSYE